MNKKRITVLSVTAVCVLCIAVLLSFSSYLAAAGNPKPIILPSAPATGPDPADSVGPTAAPSGERGLAPVEIDVSNVQAVIESLERPEAYSASLLLTRSYGAQSGGTTTTQVFRRSDFLRTDVYDGGNTLLRSVLTDGARYFSWTRVSSQQFYEGALGDVTYDELTGVPSYETLLELPRDQLRSAAYVTERDQDCIQVRCAPADTGDEDTYWISMNSGLLTRFERTRGGEPRLVLEMTDYSQEEPDSSLFTLPNGNYLWEQE